MCYRYVNEADWLALCAQFDAEAAPTLAAPRARYNIAPTQPAWIIRGPGPRELTALRWGLVPSWSRSPSTAARLCNARAETAATLPSFRHAFRQRRCLVPATGFYEWSRTAERQPYLFRLQGGGVLTFAGLWERWQPPAGSAIETFTIITTVANRVVGAVHDRMPVILTPDQMACWLAPDTESQTLHNLLRPAADDLLTAIAVSRTVNNPRIERPDCVRPVGER